MSFFERLQARVDGAHSLLCVGLDPHPEWLQQPGAMQAEYYCLRLIDATADLVCAFKPNAAFFEMYGAAGWEALQRVIRAVPQGIPVILDAKRGDIASTARAYAQAVFTTLGADAVTLSPYLGRDSIEPFLEDPGRGIFLLCKTSNPGADDLQQLRVRGEGRLYEAVCRLAQGWNAHDNIGLVVGATDPQAVERVRAIDPDVWLLAPGVGHQGGDLQAALGAGLRSDGRGLILTVSRSIASASDPRQAAAELRDRINDKRSGPPRAARRSGFDGALADALLAAGCVQFGDFQLKSGQRSPIYLDLRRLVSHPELLERVALAYLPLLEQLTFDRLAALPYAALPIVTAISLARGWRMVYPRKEVKEYGTRAPVEGEFVAGERAVVVDDLATTGGSKFEAIEQLQEAGLTVHDVVVLIDREGGARRALEGSGFRLHAVFSLRELVGYWAQAGLIAQDEQQSVLAFLDAGPEGQAQVDV